MFNKKPGVSARFFYAQERTDEIVAYATCYPRQFILRYKNN